MSKFGDQFHRRFSLDYLQTGPNAVGKTIEIDIDSLRLTERLKAVFALVNKVGDEKLRGDLVSAVTAVQTEVDNNRLRKQFEPK